MVQHKANRRGNRSVINSIIYYNIKVGYETPMSLRQSLNNAFLHITRKPNYYFNFKTQENVKL